MYKDGIGLVIPFNAFVILRSSISFYSTPPSLPLFLALVILTYTEPKPLNHAVRRLILGQINNCLHFLLHLYCHPRIFIRGFLLHDSKFP